MDGPSLTECRMQHSHNFFLPYSLSFPYLSVQCTGPLEIMTTSSTYSGIIQRGPIPQALMAFLVSTDAVTGSHDQSLLHLQSADVEDWKFRFDLSVSAPTALAETRFYSPSRASENGFTASLWHEFASIVGQVGSSVAITDIEYPDLQARICHTIAVE